MFSRNKLRKQIRSFEDNADPQLVAEEREALKVITELGTGHTIRILGN